MTPNLYFTPLFFLIFFTCFANVANADYPIYTDAERDAIDKLRPLIVEYLVPDYMKTDLYHLRLLKAARFDVENAVEMVKRTSKWRQTNNVDKILNEDLSEFFSDIPVKVEGVDKEGSPIVQVYLGKWKLRKYALSGDPELRNVPVKLFIQIWETAEQKLYEIQKSGGQNISSAYILSDLVGLSIQEHICGQCLSLEADLARVLLHYPSLFKKDIIINAPKIFARIHQLVNEILPTEVTQTFFVYTPNDKKWKYDVLNDISADQLPKEFGGISKDN